MSKKNEAALPAVADDTKLAIDDAEYRGYIAQAVDLTRSLARNEIEWYWRIGEIFSAFSAAQETRKVGQRTVDHFAADLKQEGFLIGVSTLFNAKAIFNSYKFVAIADMVSRGMRIGHLKLLMPFEGDNLDKLRQEMVLPDGSLMTVEALASKINELKRLSSSTTNKAIVEGKEVKATRPAKAPNDDEILFGGDDTVTPSEDKDFFGDTPAPGTATAEPAPEAPKNDDGKTASRGLTPQKEFSVKSPLKALRDVDSAATRLSSVLGDAWLTVAEASKVGFDGGKARENFQTQLANAKAALQEVLEPATKLLEAIKQAEGDI